MGSHQFLDFLILIKVCAVEICGTSVFVVFVCVEAVRAIRHILNSGAKRRNA